MSMIISITGNMGVGKDTMADYIVSKYGFVKVSMADPFKRIAKEIYEFSDDQLWGPSEARNRDDMRYPRPDGTYLTPRIVTQLLGSELSRLAYPETWIVYMKRVIQKIEAGHFYSETQGAYEIPGKKSEYSGIVINSCRFRNEIQGIKEMGGIAVRLKRATIDQAVFLQAGVGNHISEREQLSLPDDFFNYVLQVPEGIDAFHTVIDEFMQKAVAKSAQSAKA